MILGIGDILFRGMIVLDSTFSFTLGDSISTHSISSSKRSSIESSLFRSYTGFNRVLCIGSSNCSIGTVFDTG